MKKLKIQSIENLYQDKYIELKKSIYLDKSLKENQWVYIERTHHTKAAVVIPLLKETGEVILIKQYRVPLNQYVIEFPAGLIEGNEAPGFAGLRELEEETGYTGKVVSVSPPLSTSAGLTSENIYLVIVEISPDIKEQMLEDSEDIEVLKIKTSEAIPLLEKWSSEGFSIDSKVWAFFSMR